jgi:two-component system, response regulator PdtaR
MKPLRILVVEYDVMIGPLLAEMLEDLGHIVCGVEVDAENAMAAAARWRPELMIVDVGLGEASGIAAVKEILRGGFVPYVFVTGDVLRARTWAGRRSHPKAVSRPGARISDAARGQPRSSSGADCFALAARGNCPRPRNQINKPHRTVGSYSSSTKTPRDWN